MKDRTMFLSMAAVAVVGAAAVTLAWLGSTTTDQHESLVRLHEQLAEVQTTVAHQEQPAKERVIDLPEDGDAYHTTLVLATDWRTMPKQRRLVAWFQADPRLASLRSQTHFHEYTERSPIYRARLARAVSSVPCVMVQRSDGRVVFKASGSNLPPTSGVLADQIAASLCPRPRPQPDVQPEPAPEPEPLPLPDVRPQPPAKPAFPWALLIVAVLAGLVLPVVVHFRRAMNV